MVDTETMAFQLISISGTAKSFALESIRESKKGNIKKASQLLDKAKEQIYDANLLQEKLIGTGLDKPVSLLMVHAQDHLMNGMTIIDLVEQLID